MLSRPATRKLIAVGVNRDQSARFHQLLKMIVQVAALFTVQSQFADELLVSSLALGLAGDVGEDGGIGEHRASS